MLSNKSRASTFMISLVPEAGMESCGEGGPR